MFCRNLAEPERTKQILRRASTCFSGNGLLMEGLDRLPCPAEEVFEYTSDEQGGGSL
jgi:hypothetical protein